MSLTIVSSFHSLVVHVIGVLCTDVLIAIWRYVRRPCR